MYVRIASKWKLVYVIYRTFYVYVCIYVSASCFAAAVNAFGETFGPNSKCVDFKIEGEWEYLNKTTHPVQGGACYEVSILFDIHVYLSIGDQLSTVEP